MKNKSGNNQYCGGWVGCTYSSLSGVHRARRFAVALPCQDRILCCHSVYSRGRSALQGPRPVVVASRTKAAPWTLQTRASLLFASAGAASSIAARFVSRYSPVLYACGCGHRGTSPCAGLADRWVLHRNGANMGGSEFRIFFGLKGLVYGLVPPRIRATEVYYDPTAPRG